MNSIPPSKGIAPVRILVLLTGFLGVGKTTFLQNLVVELKRRELVPHVILNDYENADVDATFIRQLTRDVKAISGSCVCCESRDALIESLEWQPAGPRDVVIVETNGTTDPLPLLDNLACDRRTRPFRVKQVALVDAKRWGKRWRHSSLENQQVLTASHVFISYRDLALPGRFEETLAGIQKLNPRVRLTDAASLVAEIETALSQREIPVLPPLFPTADNKRPAPTMFGVKAISPATFSHDMAHAFSSVQLTIPPLVEENALKDWLKSLPPEVLRVKGVTQLPSAPGELLCFQRVEDKAELKLFPLPAGSDWSPIAVLIGSWLPAENFQADADAKLPLAIHTPKAVAKFINP